MELQLTDERENVEPHKESEGKSNSEASLRRNGNPFFRDPLAYYYKKTAKN